MITILSSLFIKNRDQVGDGNVRRAYGMLCSIVGIALNVCLFAGKYLAGVISGSIAITADAFNNLSDAGSSFISLVGFKFSGMKADADHPFGHGRIEYVSGFGVSMIIILMGFELLKTSVGKIFHPEPVETSTLAVGILIVSICVKAYMFLYNRSVGTKIQSESMKATAMDNGSPGLDGDRVCDGSQRGRMVRMSGCMLCSLRGIWRCEGYFKSTPRRGTVKRICR